MLPPRIPKLDLSAEVNADVVLSQMEDIEANELLMWMEQQKNDSEEEEDSDNENDEQGEEDPRASEVVFNLFGNVL